MGTLIALSTTHAHAGGIEADEDIRAFRRAAAGPVELRLDMLDDLTAESLRRLVRGFAPDCIVTYRRRDERGPGAPETRASAAGEEDRLRFLEISAAEGAGFVDLELSSAAALPRIRRAAPNAKAILSHHDFEGIPGDLPETFRRIEEAGADVAKVAVKARRTEDNWKAFECLRDAARPRIALCMGEDGLPSRILGAVLGAPLTYACPSSGSQGGKAAAPGQVPWRQMVESYRVPKLSRSTRVYGLIGNPVAHSLSPAMQNAAFAERDADAVYVSFRVDGGLPEVRAFLELARSLPVRGLSVTIPHKESALACAGGSDALARRIGAANTLALTEAGGYDASNTDCGAAIGSIVRAFGGAEGPGGASILRGMETLLLGAGGAARGLAVGLVDAGARLFVHNRGFERARKLCDEVGARAVQYEELKGLRYRLVVNTTSVGMHPNVEETPLEADLLPEGGLVFDSIYVPARTRLLREAERKGNRVLNGVDMFVRQGAEQFSLWTGTAAPFEAMRRAVDEALAQRGQA